MSWRRDRDTSLWVSLSLQWVPLKVAQSPRCIFKVNKPGIQADGKIRDFPCFLLALASNNAFIIKLVYLAEPFMWCLEL